MTGPSARSGRARSRKGIVGIHPGSFRKSGKQKRLRDTELGRVYGKPKVETFEGLQVGMSKRKRREREPD